MIEKYIPKGRDHAIKRKELSWITGMPDRKVRKEIEDARRNGIVILNDGDGYYITDDLDDMYRYYLRETARAMSILETRKNIRRKLKEAGYPVKK